MSTDLLYPFLDAKVLSVLDESLQQPFRTLQEDAATNDSIKKYFFFSFFKRLEPLEVSQALSILELIKICKNQNPELPFYVEDFIKLIEKKFDSDFNNLVTDNYEENKGEEAESKLNKTKIAYSEIFKTAKKWIRVIEEMRNLQFDTKPLENYIGVNICDIDSSSLNLIDITDMIKDYDEINNFLHLEDQPILLATLLNGELRNREHYELIKKDLKNEEEILEPYKKYELEKATFESAIRKVFDINFDSIPDLKSRIDKYKSEFPAPIKIPSSPITPQLEEEKKVFSENSPDKLNDEFSVIYEDVEPSDMNSLEIQNWEPLKKIIQKIVTRTKKGRNAHYYIYKVEYCKPNGQIEEVVVKCHVSQDSSALKKFQQEADIMVKAYKTESNSFLKIYGGFYDIENGKHRFTLVMESCKWSLKEEIQERSSEGNQYSELEIMKFLYDMFNACELLVDLKIIHRDIKPANIFVAEKNGETIYKIGDFDSSLASNRTINTAISTRVDVAGTEIYMAPEIYMAHINTKTMVKNEREVMLAQLSTEMKERRTIADVFSLGLTVLEMITLDEDEDVKEINRLPQERIYEKIDSITGFDWLKPILKDMLTVDFHKRLSFGRLFEKYYEILKYALPKTNAD